MKQVKKIAQQKYIYLYFFLERHKSTDKNRHYFLYDFLEGV
jgi:hypothetical protein